MFDDNLVEYVKKVESIRARVVEAGGVLTISMKELKEMYGAGRLGVQVRERIGEGLNYNQLYFLGELPNDEREEVRLYLKGSKAGRIVEAVGSVGAAGDQRIRDFAFGDEASEVNSLARDIREVLSRYSANSVPDPEVEHLATTPIKSVEPTGTPQKET